MHCTTPLIISSPSTNYFPTCLQLAIDVCLLRFEYRVLLVTMSFLTIRLILAFLMRIVRSMLCFPPTNGRIVNGHVRETRDLRRR